MTPSWNANDHVKTTIDDAKKYRYLFECNWSPGDIWSHPFCFIHYAKLWGNTLTTPLAQSRMRDVYQLVRRQSPHCLKVTSTGNDPRHSLYLSKSLIPVPYQL